MTERKDNESKSQSMSENADLTAGRYAYDRLDRVLHEKARLGILVALMSQPDGLLFNHLKDSCSLTDGNLSRHLQILQKEGLLVIDKTYRRSRTRTLCKITSAGRARFSEYLLELGKVLEDATAAAPNEATNDSTDPSMPPGWPPA